MFNRILAVLACFALIACSDDATTTSSDAGGAGGADAGAGAGGAGGADAGAGAGGAGGFGGAGAEGGFGGAGGYGGTGAEGGFGGAGGFAGEGGEGGEGGAGGTGGAVETPSNAAECVSFEAADACWEDAAVSTICDGGYTCADDPLYTSCFEDAECESGFCPNDNDCNYAHADCLEAAGYIALADCLRLFPQCEEQMGEGNESDCSSLASDCFFALPSCE